MLEEWWKMPADIHQVASGGFYIFQKVTELLGRKLRKDVTYRSVPLDDARSSMIANGISASFTEALIETPASFNHQERWALDTPASENTTRTTFKQWAAESFAASILA
jgi:hypothetical protein